MINDLHPVVNETVMKNREEERASAVRRRLSNFHIGDYKLVARRNFFTRERLPLR